MLSLVRTADTGTRRERRERYRAENRRGRLQARHVCRQATLLEDRDVTCVAPRPIPETYDRGQSAALSFRNLERWVIDRVDHSWANIQMELRRTITSITERKHAFNQLILWIRRGKFLIDKNERLQLAASHSSNSNQPRRVPRNTSELRTWLNGRRIGELYVLENTVQDGDQKPKERWISGLFWYRWNSDAKKFLPIAKLTAEESALFFEHIPVRWYEECRNKTQFDALPTKLVPASLLATALTAAA